MAVFTQPASCHTALSCPSLMQHAEIAFRLEHGAYLSTAYVSVCVCMAIYGTDAPMDIIEVNPVCSRYTKAPGTA
eukprot:9251-Eustigmatos_ZCMA.PRE.1